MAKSNNLQQGLTGWGWAMIFALVLTPSVSLAWPEAADDDETTSVGSEETDGGETASQDHSSPTFSRLQIHGYITQGYGFTDGNQIFGIPEEGTTEYRTLALQFRYQATEQDQFVVQLDHERVGLSPAQDLSDDVELDWAFYERRFGGTTQVRVGRVPLPFGIYNEIRDVGTLLPFYRPPSNLYNDTNFATETLDGVVATHRFGGRSAWSLQGDLYFGGWDSFQTTNSPEPRRVRVDNAAGVQLWLETPVDGLRFGAGASTYRLEQEGEDVRNRWDSFILSIDGNFSRFLARAEYSEIDFDNGGYKAYYGQLGFYPTEKVRLFVEAQFAELTLVIPFVGDLALDINDDVGFAIDYLFRPDLVLRGEYHWNEGFSTEDPLPNVFAPPLETQFGIISLAFSF